MSMRPVLPYPSATPMDFEAMNPLHIAATHSSESIERELQRMRFIMTADEVAEKVNEQALDKGRTGGCTPLHYACQFGHAEGVTLLLEAGANPNAKKNNGATPILSAIYAAGFSSLRVGGIARMQDFKACVVQLLDHPRFDMEINDNTGVLSPAWVCVGNGFPEKDVLLPFLTVVLEKGCNPDGVMYGMPALHMALFKGHEECALALVKAGADLKARGRINFDDSLEFDGTEETWRALEACRAMYDDRFARRLEEAAASAVVWKDKNDGGNGAKVQESPVNIAIEFAQKAIDEFERKGGSNGEKAARFIDEALKPENQPPRPLRIRALRGQIYYALARDLLLVSPARSKDGEDGCLNGGMESLNLGENVSLLDAVQEKLKIAQSEFIYCTQNDESLDGHLYHMWDEGLALIALGQFDKGNKRCLSSFQSRMKQDVDDLLSAPGHMQRFYLEKSPNRTNNKLVNQMETAYVISRLQIAQKAMEAMKGSLQEDSEMDVKDVLGQAVSLRLLDQPLADSLSDMVASGDLEQRAVASAWGTAVKKAKSAEAAFAQFRGEAAGIAIGSAATVHSRSIGTNREVLGMLLESAHTWGAENLEIPVALKKFDRLPKTKKCNYCGASDPSLACKCDKAFYCGDECKNKAWEKHKKSCAARNRRARKRGGGKKKRRR